jgi:CelD/BcsL family acetyltransferase involved in cellulose biosynthesis
VSVELELVAAGDDRVESIWRALEVPARPAYFLSWGWVENWLACLPREARPELAVLTCSGAPVAACFLGRRLTRAHHLLPSRAMFVNATGIARFDELTVEHNGILRAPGGPSLRALFARLAGECDEPVLPAIDASELAGPGEGETVRIDREVPAPFVDLERVRASHDGYVALLGPATRAQLRRARRHAGELVLEVARDAGHALAIYDELVALHGAAWRARGLPGAFADPWFDSFHRRLIASRHASGELELSRVTVAGRTLGGLYNLVSNGRVLSYQSGFDYGDDPHAKPGYLCHALAIEAAARAGHAKYDFLGGEARYKHDLATDETRLVWARLQRQLLRFAVEDRLRGWKRAATAATKDLRR